MGMTWKACLALTLIVLCGLTALGQSRDKDYPDLKPYRHPYPITETYNKFSDENKLWLKFESMYAGVKYDLDLKKP